MAKDYFFLAMKVINSTKQKEIADDIKIANTILARMKGLLGRNSLAEGEGLLIRPCKGIHTFGMKFPIDVVFIDGNNCVIATLSNIQPNRVSNMYFGAACVLEVQAGTVNRTATFPGDQLEIL